MVDLSGFERLLGSREPLAYVGWSLQLGTRKGLFDHSTKKGPSGRRCDRGCGGSARKRLGQFWFPPVRELAQRPPGQLLDVTNCRPGAGTECRATPYKTSRSRACNRANKRHFGRPPIRDVDLMRERAEQARLSNTRAPVSSLDQPQHARLRRESKSSKSRQHSPKRAKWAGC